MRCVPIRFQHPEMHSRQRADNSQMAQLLCSDVHQRILSFGIVRIETLNGILHRGGGFAVGTSELFQQHVPKRGSGRTD
jgi:hypothetical protein